MDKENFQMPKNVSNSDAERRKIALVMMVAGIAVWIFTGVDKQFIKDIVKGIGFFLFAFGLYNIGRAKPWDEMTHKERMMKAWFMIVLALILIGVIVAMIFIRR
jgi:hypothetical protein